jgi:hypothetical protein
VSPVEKPGRIFRHFDEVAMNSDEQALIDGLFTRLQQAEKDSGPRDALAQERIKEHVTAQPAAPYYMAQAILVQEAAIKRLDEQNRKLQADLAQAQAQAQAAPAQSSGGGFLSSIFGSGARDSRPAEQPSTGGWREPAPRYAAPPPQPQQGYAQPAPAAAPAAGGFMRGALQTAAGVAGGVMLAEGISSLFHHNNQPQEIVEVLQESPAQANDWGGGGDEQRLSDNSSFGNNDAGGFADSGYDDGGSGFFSDDDDTFV